MYPLKNKNRLSGLLIKEYYEKHKQDPEFNDRLNN
jgi:hypothetical protein